MLAHLECLGVPEAVAREHSLEWIGQVAEDLGRRQRTDLANQLTVGFLAAAAANGSEPASAEVERILAELNPPDEDDPALSHLLDPDAETDLGSVSDFNRTGAFGVQRVKASQEVAAHA